MKSNRNRRLSHVNAVFLLCHYHVDMGLIFFVHASGMLFELTNRKKNCPENLAPAVESAG